MFDFSEFLSGVKDELDRRVERATIAVEQFAAVRVIGQAQENAPIETGALMASGTTQPAVFTGGEIRCECGFNVDYAAARHERQPEDDAPPKQNPSGTAGWKFLERAMRDVAGQFTTFVGSQLEGTGASGENTI